MLRTRNTVIALAVTSLTALALGGAQALAAAPAAVSIRVEGQSATLVGETSFTTDTAPVEGEGGHECPGTSAIGALQQATGGNWSGKWYGGSIKEGKFVGLGYAVETIEGESHPLASGTYWGFWLNDRYSEEGVCATELGTGDQLLFAPVDESAELPSPLAITAPAAAAAGEAVPVTVTSYESSTGDPRPADGASISYEGHTTTTDSEGHASLTLEGGGPAYLYVTAPNSIRAFTHLCVYLPGETCNADGTISGTPTGGGKASGGVDGYTSTGPGSGPGPAPLSGPDAITAALSSVRGGHTYSRSRAPRVLAGHVHASLALRSVSLMLRRSYHGRCYAYAGSSERFVRARCGHGAFFQVATGPSFSYLLPTRLPAGHYVLELEAIDLAGNRTALAKGSTEVSFDVR